MASGSKSATYAEVVAREKRYGRELPADEAISSGDEEGGSEWESEREDDVKESDQVNTSSDLNFSRTKVIPVSRESALTTRLQENPAMPHNVPDSNYVRQELVSELGDDVKENLLQQRSVQRPFMGKGKSQVAAKPEKRCCSRISALKTI